MADMSKFYEKAREIDKANGVVSENGSMAQYYAKAREIDRKNGNVSPAAPTTPNTTRADGAGVGGNGYEIQMPKLEVELPQIRAFGAADYRAPNLKRIGNVLAAAGTGAAAGFVETAGQLTQPQGLTIGESARVALQGGTRAQEQAAEQEKAQRIRENIKDPLYATADRLTEQSAAYTEKAKEGRGKVGQFAVDLGVTGTQLLGDMALGLINPVLGTGAMATRVFGGSAQEARQAGATETEQQLYGLGSAATSVLVEKIANVGKAFKTAYGGSIAGGKVDDLLTKLTGKLMKNPAGQRILASAAGEAGEEALEALLQPALQAIYDKGATLNKTWFGSTEELTDYLTDVGYNALLGGALGALGGGGNIAAPATTETAQGGAEAAQEAQSTPAAGNETPAPSTGTQRPQNGAKRPTWGAYMEEGNLFGGGKQRAGFTSLENAMANQFERETGISIESVESILGGLANGDYNSANWVARIAQDAKDPKMVVVAHELTHHLQTLAPQEYESFRTAVADYFTRAGGEAALTDMMNRYRSAYGAAGQNLSDSAVMDEMAADFTEVLLTDADLFGQFAQQNRTLAERLLDALRAFIEKIRATFTGRARDAAAQEATGKTLNELEMIAEQWQGVYRAAAAAYGQNANTATQEGDGVRYSIKFPTFSEADIKENSIKLQTMDSVATLTGNELGEQSVPLGIRVRKYFESLGNNVYTDRFGDVSLANSSVHSEFRHGNTPPKVMTYAAVPAVLKKGVVIYQIKKNKHGLERIVVAAPVKVGTPAETMYVGVMLQRDPQNQRLYLHDVVTEKELSAESDGHLIPTGPNTSNGELHTTYILRNALKVKGNMAQLKSTAPLRQMMAEMPQQMMIRMPRLTTVEQDEAEAAGVEAAPVEDTVQLPQLGLTDADVPGTEPLTRQDIARELAWRARMANEPAAPQVMGEVKLPDLSADMEEAGMGVADFTGNVETVPETLPWFRPPKIGKNTDEAGMGAADFMGYTDGDSKEISKLLDELINEMEAPTETLSSSVMYEERQKERRGERKISAKTEQPKKSFKETAAENWSYFKRKMVDSGEAVARIGKAINDKYLYPFYNMARASASAGVNMIAGEQTNVMGKRVGESLNAIFDPIRAKGEEYYNVFQLYMFDLHNMARMSITEKSEPLRKEAQDAFDSYVEDHPEFAKMTPAQIKKQAEDTDELKAEDAREYMRLIRWVDRTNNMKNKAILDWTWTAEDSRARSERLLREHPEFAQYREQVRKYIDNLMQYRVDSGLITQQDADFLREYYPDYVPTYREEEISGFRPPAENGSVRVAKTVGKAKGGEERLMPIHEALSKQTLKVVREGSKNRFGKRLLEDYFANEKNAGVKQYIQDAQEQEANLDIYEWDSLEEKDNKKQTFSVYQDGKLYDMTVNNELMEAIKTLSPDQREAVKLTGFIVKANRLYKALITGYNPFFTVRNIVRDLQSAGLYSRDLGAWAKNYRPALKQIFADGEMWKQYRALGGDMSSLFDYETNDAEQINFKYKKDERKGAVPNLSKNVVSKVQFLNMAMEQAPRLAEFMAVMEKGDGSMESAMDAMLAAADVTTNFGRSGTLAKYLNQYYIPFLNPGIQGFDKLMRFMKETKTGKQWTRLVLYASILGIAPRLLGNLIYGDDDEWEELRDSDRNANYMFKLKDGLWFKLPRGREVAILATITNAVIDQIRGEDVRWGRTLLDAASQVTPANPLNENILKPLFEADLFDPSSPGRTWYGGDIEGQRLQNYAPRERYDSSTDVVSKAIGGALNLSPKKLNYLANQYTGVAGDIVLPMLTPQAERNPFAAAFTVDTVMSNELSSKFYEKSDKLMYAKNGGDAVAAVVSRYWNRVGSEVSKLYGEIRDVENSNLSNREKKEQVQELQRQINAIQREALATVDQYTAAVESSLFGNDDDAADFAYRETNREVFGAEYALETYNKDVYAKAQEAAKSGVSYEAYYDYYFATKDIESDKDASGKTITGSKREKVLAEINAMDLTVEQKNALYYASGYVESTLYEAPWYTIQMPRL